MQDKVKKAKEFIQKYGIGRDSFIQILSHFETDEDYMMAIDYFYKGQTLHIAGEDWMKDIKNKRKLYEEAVLDENNEKLQEVVKENKDLTNLQLMKKIQRLTDTNNNLRKHYRDNFRPIIESEDTLKEINECLRLVDFKMLPQKPIVPNNDKKGIIHFSDLHLDMLIQEPRNTFDFEIASKRLRKHIQSSIKLFRDNDISDVFILNTADTISSDRRDSEKYNCGTSRGRAFSIALKLLSLAIREVAQEFNVYYATCSANESRIEKDHEYDDFSLSNNFDIMLHNTLSVLFEDKNVKFIETDHAEGIVSIYPNFKILMLHGSNIPDSGIQKKITEIKG